jgi:hypothetical protein
MSVNKNLLFVVALAAIISAGVYLYQARHNQDHQYIRREVPTEVYDSWVHY